MINQRQPLIQKRQVLACTIEVVCFFIMLLFRADKFYFKIVLMLLWITCAEMLMPTILKKIGAKNCFKSLLFYLPFYVFIIPLLACNEHQTLEIITCGGGITAVLLMLFVNKAEIKRITSGIRSNRPLTKEKLIVEIVSRLIAVVAEEILFRGYWIASSKDVHYSIAAISSACLFVFAHYINRWSKEVYKKKAYLMLFILGLVLAIVYTYVRSIWFCIFLHILYNISDYIVLLKRYKIKEKERIFDDYE